MIIDIRDGFGASIGSASIQYAAEVLRYKGQYYIRQGNEPVYQEATFATIKTAKIRQPKDQDDSNTDAHI